MELGPIPSSCLTLFSFIRLLLSPNWACIPFFPSGLQLYLSIGLNFYPTIGLRPIPNRVCTPIPPSGLNLFFPMGFGPIPLSGLHLHPRIWLALLFLHWACTLIPLSGMDLVPFNRVGPIPSFGLDSSSNWACYPFPHQYELCFEFQQNFAT